MAKEDKGLALTKTYDLANPPEVLKMATTLKDYVVRQKLYTSIKGKNYAHVDGWQFAGFLGGLHARVENVENLSNPKETKWKSTVNVYQGEKLLGTGIALCSSLETSKKQFDEYAILSMAQTRAIGKAYRNSIGWIMKLAGYEATPSEEMRKVHETASEPVIDYSDNGKVPGPDGKPTYICSVCGDPVTETVANYSKKVYKKVLCREDQKNAKNKK